MSAAGLPHPQASPKARGRMLAPSARALLNLPDRKGRVRLGPVSSPHLGRYLPHTALSALAQLRAAAIRGTLTGSITLPAAGHGDDHADSTPADGDVSDADLQIPLDDAPVPARGGQPCPPGIAPVKLSIAETARLAGLARQHTAGLITRARLAFALRWSVRRRLHQAIARWHHHSARLLSAGTG
jgi:hypothetical protein